MGIIEELSQSIESAWDSREDEGCGCCADGGEEARRVAALEKARILIGLLTGKEVVK